MRCTLALLLLDLALSCCMVVMGGEHSLQSKPETSQPPGKPVVHKAKPHHRFSQKDFVAGGESNDCSFTSC